MPVLLKVPREAVAAEEADAVTAAVEGEDVALAATTARWLQSTLRCQFQFQFQFQSQSRPQPLMPPNLWWLALPCAADVVAAVAVDAADVAVVAVVAVVDVVAVVAVADTSTHRTLLPKRQPPPPNECAHRQHTHTLRRDIQHALHNNKQLKDD